MSHKEIYVVDDDRTVRDTLSVILQDLGYKAICFADHAALTAAMAVQVPSCIFLDIYIPGKSGLEILRELRDKRYPAPVVVISGRASISDAVEAIRNGAVDFIEKPFNHGKIIAAITKSTAAFSRREAEAPKPKMQLSYNFPGRDPLNRREQDVLELLISGSSNKSAARQLGISPRTVEYHRAKILKKMRAKNAFHLINVFLQDGASGNSPYLQEGA